MTALIPRCFVGDLELTDYPFSLAYNELDLGAGENMMSFFDALLTDGSIGSSVRTGNRTLSVPIYVEGRDMGELADNEATLIRACEKRRNTFTLDPGDGFGPPSVYDTFRIQSDHERDDDYEAALLRRWVLTIPALPWARSASPTVEVFVGALGGADPGYHEPVTHGSVRTPLSLEVAHSGAVAAPFVVYTDPALVGSTYRPHDDATWADAPAGAYAFYVLDVPSLSTGDVLTAEFTQSGVTQTLRTRYVGGGPIPLGIVQLGGLRTGLVGSVTVTVKKNGSTVTPTEPRLYRVADDTALTIYDTAGAPATALNVDAPSLDFPEGALWVDGADALASGRVVAWGNHMLDPAGTGLTVETLSNGENGLTTTCTSYNQFHTFASR